MMEAAGYLAAAYAVVLGTLAGYALRLARRERALRHALARPMRPQAPRGG